MKYPESEKGRRGLAVAGIVLLALAAGVLGALVVDGRDGHDRGEKHAMMMRGGGPPGFMDRGERGGMGGGERFRGPGGMRGFGDRGGAPHELMERALRDHLDVTDEELTEALGKAVDDAVEADELTEEQGKLVKERIEEKGTFLSEDKDDAEDADKDAAADSK